MLEKDRLIELFHALYQIVRENLHQQLLEEIDWKEEYGLQLVTLESLPGGFEYRYKVGETLITLLVNALSLVENRRIKFGLIIQAYTGQILFSFEMECHPDKKEFRHLVDMIEDCVIQVKGVHVMDLPYFEVEEDSITPLIPTQETEDGKEGQDQGLRYSAKNS